MHYYTVRSFLLVCILLHFAACKKPTDSNEVYNYKAYNLADINIKQYDTKVFTDSVHIVDTAGSDGPVAVSFKNLPPGVFAEPASVSGTPPFSAVFKMHSRPQGYGAFTSYLNIATSSNKVQLIPFKVNVTPSANPCVELLLGGYVGVDACSPAFGNTGYDVSVFSTNPSSGKILIGLPLGTIQATVKCNDSLFIDDYNGGSVLVNGVGTYDDLEIKLFYQVNDGTQHTCVTTLTRKPY